VSGVPDRPSSARVEAPPWAWALLRAARVARLATADASGAPHVVPVCFVVGDDGVLWTPIDAKPKSTRRLRRVRNLAENPRASLLVDHYEEDWRELRWVAVHGRGELVEGSAAAPALRALRAKYPQYAEVEAGPETIRLVPERILAWSAARPTPVSVRST
jgi:PPOX class probable F420-dependent enzyme